MFGAMNVDMRRSKMADEMMKVNKNILKNPKMFAETYSPS